MISKFDFVDSNHTEWIIGMNDKHIWINSFFHHFRYNYIYILKRDITSYWYHKDALEVIKYVRKILENKAFV